MTKITAIIFSFVLMGVLVTGVTHSSTVSAQTAQVHPDYSMENRGLSGWFRNFFKPKDPKTMPEFTLKAPFAGQDEFPVKMATPDTHNILSLKTDSGSTIRKKDLTVPHRPDNIISLWLQRAVSEAFSFKKGNYEEHKGFLNTGMSDTAIREYDRFMQSSNLLPNIQSGTYKIQVAIEKKPDLLCRYVEDNRFRWLYDMPLTFTLLPASTTEYSANAKPKNWDLSVVAQVGRVPEGGAEGVIIDHINIWASDEEWNRLKLLDPTNLPCSWQEVLQLVR